MPNKENEGLYAEFHLHPVLANPVPQGETPKEGRPVYKDELYIQIQVKGQKNQIRDRKAKDSDKEDFPNAWDRWQKQNEQISDGTPISYLPGAGPSMVLEMRTLGIRTVEDMAEMNDAACTNMRGGYMFRERAKAYLASASVETDARDTSPKTASNDIPVDVNLLQSDPTVIPARKRGRPRKNPE